MKSRFVAIIVTDCSQNYKISQSQRELFFKIELYFDIIQKVVANLFKNVNNFGICQCNS